MAEEIEIVIKGDSSQAVESIDNLTKSVDEYGKEVEEVSKENQTAIKKTGEEAKKQSKVVNGLGKAVKGVGTALKALGIGLIIALVAKLTEALSQNQKVTDFLSTTFTTISIVFNQVFEAITDTYDAVQEATGGFDALGKVLKGILTIALTPLKVTFFGLKLGIQEVQLAWEKSFLGDKDPETINRLNDAIKETKQDLADIATEAINAGKDIVGNFSEAVGELTTIGETAIKELGEVSVTTAIEQAKLITELEKSAQKAEAINRGLIERYDIQAEKLRQIRDDESKSIEDRIEANEELGRVLSEQEDLLLSNAQTSIDLAREKLSLDKNNIELQTALIDAENELFAIQARVEGQRSEQLINVNSLLKERNELEQEFFDLLAEEEQAEIDAEDARLERLEKQLKKESDLNTKADDEERKREDALKQYKINTANNIANALASIAGEQTALAKAAAVAQAVISTYTGINNALSQTTDFTPTQSLRFANAIAVGVAGFANVKKILSTSSKGSTSAPSSPSTPSTPTQEAPSFNLVQGTGTNQIAETLAEQPQPIEAFVVSSNVTTAQSLDRNIIDNATI